jgi:hypothetical protein
MCAAGAMSYPDADAYLRPKQFFDIVRKKGVLGEAFLKSSPYLNWTVGFFGDPLAEFELLSDSTEIHALQTDIDEHERWRLLAMDVAKSIAYYANKRQKLLSALDDIVLSSDIYAELDLLYAIDDYYTQWGVDDQIDTFAEIVEQTLFYPMKRFASETYKSLYPNATTPPPTIITLSEYLEYKNFEISAEIYNIIYNASLTSFQKVDLNNKYGKIVDHLLSTGSWEIEFVLDDETGVPSTYSFDLEVSTVSDFSDIVYSLSSGTDDGWSYEISPNQFAQVPKSGVSSFYVGRRIKFVSTTTTTLTPDTMYYFRYRQSDSLIPYSWTEFEDICATPGAILFCAH